MTPTAYDALRIAVQQDEGLRLKPYTDTVGKLTIGYGRNLTDVGISSAEASLLLDHDLESAVAALTQRWPIVLTLNDARQVVLGNMAFNMGLSRLGGFTQMWLAIGRGDFDEAADEMLDSTWATQVGARATRLAAQMRAGVLT